MKPLLDRVLEHAARQAPVACAFDLPPAPAISPNVSSGSEGRYRGGRELHFAPRTLIFLEGAEAESIFQVVDGAVMLYKLLPDGRRQETVSRSLTKLKRRGVVSIGKLDEIYIDDVCRLCRLTGTHLTRGRWCSSRMSGPAERMGRDSWC